MSSGVTSFKNDPISYDPTNIEEARFNMLGLNMVGELIDPCTFPRGEIFGGINCSEVDPIYWFSGDPVNANGWINTHSGDQRSITNVGQFDLPVGETKEVMVAYIIGRGNDPLNSIEVVKSYADEIQLFYENNFGYPIVLNNDDQNPIYNFTLYQNYPNPFNPITTIQYELIRRQFVQLKIYDVLGNEITTMVKEEKPAGGYEVVFNATELTSGIYF
ncbi:MAG: T9SS type A sorting domain-containing protein [Ignavibacterium sp.]|nr:MAG: T9SS type A sorting domain-containing protein [Ignavibacterium sp.]